MTTPTLIDQIDGIIERHAKGTWTMLPGVVESYNAATLRADVQPALKQGVITEDNDRVAETLPVVPNCPVAWPHGYLGTLAPGDHVVLIFASGSLDVWLTRGGVVDPNDDHRSDLSDAVAFPLQGVPLANVAGFEATIKASTYFTALRTMLVACAGAFAALGQSAAASAINAFILSTDPSPPAAMLAAYASQTAKVK
jgi:hypothetical protein